MYREKKQTQSEYEAVKRIQRSGGKELPENRGGYPRNHRSRNESEEAAGRGKRSTGRERGEWRIK